MENQEINVPNEIKVSNQTKKSKVFRGCAFSFLVFCILSLIIAIIYPEDKDNKSKIQTTKIEKDKAYLDSIKNICIPMYKDEISKIMNSVETEYDDFENITWYIHKNHPKYTNTNAFFISAFSKKNIFGGRLIVRYSGEDWLFVKKITVKCGETKFYLNTEKVNRNNGSGSVWEWIDLPVDNSVEVVLTSIISSDNTKIRFEGDQYSFDYTISSKDKTALIDMYNLIRYNNEIATLESN